MLSQSPKYNNLIVCHAFVFWLGWSGGGGLLCWCSIVSFTQMQSGGADGCLVPQCSSLWPLHPQWQESQNFLHVGLRVRKGGSGSFPTFLMPGFKIPCILLVSAITGPSPDTISDGRAVCACREGQKDLRLLFFKSRNLFGNEGQKNTLENDNDALGRNND